MKKIAFILLLSILLTGCGQNELDTFVDEFNQSARKYDTTELMENEFGKIESEDGEEWRNLFESKEYLIRVYYENNSISGYHINVESDTTSIDKKGKGYNAVLTLADTLGLNISDLEKGMQEGFNKDFYEYEDGDYKVRIYVINIISASMGITIEKK
ncbi:hypothetical protein NST02_23605 [Robertmurraya sp. FSL W8-0741]|uniref:hypothetical protein n=1 Tax=Robertmurraya sp. FSL W8-0741 TaxID=2954629 RepID=UPI0030FCEFF1